MSDTRRLALELHEIRQLALGHATNPQFGNSSVDGEGLSFRDGDGNEVGRIGGDEGNGLEIRYVDAPKPLPPTAPVATGDANLIRVEWDGGWVRIEGGTPVRDLDAISAPAVDRVEVHVSMDENFVPDPVLSFAGVLPVTDEGGAHTVGPLAEAGDYYVVLMARGKDGQYSAPSQRVHVVTTVGLMENELFDLALRADEARESADGKNTVHYGEEPTPPDGGFSEGDLWFDTVEDPETGVRKNTPHLWDPTANDGEGGWVSAADSRVDAVQDAVADLESALDDIVVDGSGTQNFYQTEPPKLTDVPAPAEGDLWFDQNDQNKPYIFRDAEWVSIRDDSFLSTAKNLTPWDSTTGNVHAISGQTFTIPSGELRVQAGPYPSMPDLEVLGIVIGDGENAPVSSAVTRLPFQGVLDSAGVLSRDATAIPYETRPLGVSGQIFFSKVGTGLANPSLRAYATFYDIEGNVLRSEMAQGQTRPLDPDVPGDVGFVGAGFTHVAELDSVIELRQSLRSDAVSFAMHWEVWTPRVAGSTAIIATAEARVQVPEGGIAADAITEAKLAAEAVTETKIAPDSVSSPKIIAGAVQTAHLLAEAVTAEKMAVGTITAESGIIGSLNAGVITAGTLNSARLAANSITADKLLIGSLEELAPSPAVYGADWALENGASFFGWANAYDGTGLQLPSGSRALGPYRSTSRGRSVHAEAWVGRYGGLTGDVNLNIRLYFYDRNRTYMTSLLAATGLGAVSGSAVAPDNAVYVRIGLLPTTSFGGGWLSVRDMSGRPQVGATLIENGAITTDKIAVGAITAESGIIGSLDAGVITTGELRGELIRAQSIAGEKLAVDAIDGKTITGATVRTSSAGARVEMDSSGLRQYNLAGQPIVDMTGGNVTLMGALYSGQPGFSRVQIDNQLWPGGQYVPREDGSMAQALGAGMRVGRDAYHSVDVFHGEYLETSGATGEAAVVRGPGESAASAIYMTNSGKAWWRSSFAGERRVDLSIFPDKSMYQVGSDRAGVTRAATTQRAWGSGSAGYGHHQWWANAAGHAVSLQMDLGHPGGSAENNMEYRVERTGGSRGNGLLSIAHSASRLGFGSAYVDAAVGTSGTSTLTLAGENVRLTPIPARTTGSANTIITGTGYLARTGSSRALKLSIEDLDDSHGGTFDDALLSVPAVTWFDRGDAERLASYKTAVENDVWPDVTPDTISPLRRIPGVIAEDVHDAGLHELVEYDESGKPSGVLYDRIGPALIPVVRRLRDRVNELEKKMGEMANA